MRFTKRQRAIIQKVASGNVWDIRSFADNFQIGRVVGFDWGQVQMNFQNDPEASDYYCPKNLSPTPANLIRKDVFKEKVRRGQADPEMYEKFVPQLEKTYSHHLEDICGRRFSFDFYQGVRIADSFEDIIDFLAIWQILREHALVLEVSQPLDAETAGLFFRQEEGGEPPPFKAEKESQTLFFSDSRYVGQNTYCLSRDHLEICRDFLGKRIYPAPGLKLFVKNRFRTQDEIAQRQALFTAWVAILVALFVGFLPYLFPARAPVEETPPSSGGVCQENDVLTDASPQADDDSGSP